MSYCRTGFDSDVYVIRTFEQTLQCVSCPLLGDRGTVSRRSNDGMIRHLETHRAAGHKVPGRVLERLHQEKFVGWL